MVSQAFASYKGRKSHLVNTERKAKSQTLSYPELKQIITNASATLLEKNEPSVNQIYQSRSGVAEGLISVNEFLLLLSDCSGFELLYVA